MLRGRDRESFKKELLDLEIKDEGVHHEFTSGVHGEKLDFEVVKRGTPTWQRWVELNSAMVKQCFPDRMPPILISIANGTNELTDDIANELNRHGNYEDRVFTGHTEKLTFEDGRKLVQLTDEARRVIAHILPDAAVEIDDVATSGSTTAMPVESLRRAGIEELQVVYTWLRSVSLPCLDALMVPYRGIIDNHPIPDYTPAECERVGLCMQEIPLIPYGHSAVPTPE